MSQDAPTIHPFDRKDGPDIINFNGSRVAVRPRAKSGNVNVSRETIESIKRTLYNAIDKLERMAANDK